MSLQGLSPKIHLTKSEGHFLRKVSSFYTGNKSLVFCCSWKKYSLQPKRNMCRNWSGRPSVLETFLASLWQSSLEEVTRVKFHKVQSCDVLPLLFAWLHNLPADLGFDSLVRVNWLTSWVLSISVLFPYILYLNLYLHISMNCCTYSAFSWQNINKWEAFEDFFTVLHMTRWKSDTEVVCYISTQLQLT